MFTVAEAASGRTGEDDLQEVGLENKVEVAQRKGVSHVEGREYEAQSGD